MRGRLRRVLVPELPVGDVIRRELLVRAAQQSLQSNLMGVGLIFLIVLPLWTAGIGPGLAAWTGLALANVIVFHLCARRILQHEPRPVSRVGRQELAYGLLNVLGGVTWGGLAVLALPGGEHAGLRAVVCTAVMVAMAGNMAFAAPTALPFLLFHLCLAAVAAAGLFLGGAWQLALIILFAAGAAMPLQQGLYLHIAQASLVARQNLLLAAELREQRAAVELTNLQLIEANAELSHRATRDPLTGLANRQLFAEHLSTALVRQRCAGTGLAVLYVDLDRFKLINDTFGHAAGDDLLQQVAARLQAEMRRSDLLARMGGDEFVALVLDEAGPGAGRRQAQRILAGFGEPFQIAGRTHQVTPSIGLAEDDGVSTADELVQQADTALYRAKALGRNQIAVFDSAPGLAVQPVAGPDDRTVS